MLTYFPSFAQYSAAEAAQYSNGIVPHQDPYRDGTEHEKQCRNNCKQKGRVQILHPLGSHLLARFNDRASHAVGIGDVFQVKPINEDSNDGLLD